MLSNAFAVLAMLNNLPGAAVGNVAAASTDLTGAAAGNVSAASASTVSFNDARGILNFLDAAGPAQCNPADTAEDLQQAQTDPLAFVERLGLKSQNIALKLAIAKLRPQIKPKLEEQGFSWSDFKLILEEVDTVEQTKKQLFTTVQ